MISYQIHGNNILELQFDGVGSGFIDLADVSKAIGTFPDEADPVEVYIDTQSVRDLFGFYGILEQCPLEPLDEPEE